MGDAIYYRRRVTRSRPKYSEYHYCCFTVRRRRSFRFYYCDSSSGCVPVTCTRKYCVRRRYRFKATAGATETDKSAGLCVDSFELRPRPVRNVDRLKKKSMHIIFFLNPSRLPKKTTYRRYALNKSHRRS